MGGPSAWALADHAGVWGSADRRSDQRCRRVHAGVLAGMSTTIRWASLNLPRALVTEKAFPENELVVFDGGELRRVRRRGLRMLSMSGRSSMRGRSLKPMFR